MKLLALAVLILIFTGAAGAQLVVGVDGPDEYVYLIDVNNDTATPLFTGHEAWALAADDANRVLYFTEGVELFRVAYDTLVPEFVGNITYEGAATSIVGLAYDPGTGMLYGTKNISTEGVYAIDPTTAEAQLLYAFDTSYDFGGIDVDLVTGALYGTNDGANAPSGLGLYKIDPYGQVIDFVVAYQGGYTDIDGLGAGGGRAYFVIDEPGLIYVYNLLTNQFEDPLTSPFTTSEIFSAGAWAPSLIPEPAALSILALGLFGLLRRRKT